MTNSHAGPDGASDLNQLLEDLGLQLKEHAVLRKYDGDRVGDPEALAEVIVIDDGVVTDRWYRGDERDAPE